MEGRGRASVHCYVCGYSGIFAAISMISTHCSEIKKSGDICVLHRTIIARAGCLVDGVDVDTFAKKTERAATDVKR